MNRRELLWGFAAQGLNIGLWLVLLPIILRFFSAEEVGLWLVFLTIAGITQLVESGVQPTLARNVAYVHGGVQNLLRSGIDTGSIGSFNPILMANLLRSGRKIYAIIACLAAVFLWGFGTWYIVAVIPNRLGANQILLAWLLFSAGYVINFFYGYVNAFLQGMGYVLLSNKTIVISRFIQLIIGLVLIAQGAGLLSLGVATLASTIVGRIVGWRYLKDTMPSSVLVSKASGNKSNEITRILWHNASRYALVMVGAFLVTRSNILISTSRVGLIEAAGFGLVIQILMTAQGMATLPFNIQLPILNSKRANGEMFEVRQRFILALLFGIIVYAFFVAGLLLFGQQVLSIIGSSTSLPSNLVTALLCVSFLLDLVHGMCANLITIDNKIPFVNAALLTGFLIVVCAWFVGPEFGLTGMAVNMVFWQLIYNNWKWPLEASKLLEANFFQLIGEGLRKIYLSLRFGKL